MSFGELDKAKEDVNIEFLNNMTKMIFKFYTENLSQEEFFDEADYKSAKKCLKVIFKSIQKVPKEKKNKKPPGRKKSNAHDKSSNKKIGNKKDVQTPSWVSDDSKLIKSFCK